MKLSVAAAAIAFSGTALIFTPTAASAAQQDSKPQASAKADLQGSYSSKFGRTDAGSGKLGGSGKDAALTTGKPGAMSGKSETMDYDGIGGPLDDVSGGEDMAGKFAGADGEFGMDDMDVGAKFETASMDTGGKGWSGDDIGSDELSSGDTGGKLASGTDAGTSSAKQASDRNSSEPVQAAAVTKDATLADGGMGHGKEASTGMGGPEEATTEYPPCSPGPGDDRCIQLYERGVATPTNLALNEQLGPDRAGVGLAAMGGPYEPIEQEDEYASAWSEHEAPAADDWTAEEDELAVYEPEYQDKPYYGGYEEGVSGM